MEGQLIYQDFDLLIEPGPPGSYRARVLRSPAGECSPVQFTVPFSGIELENLVLKIGRGRRRSRGSGRPESAPLKDFGGRLYGAVFHGELREVLQRSLSLTHAQKVGMRLRLRLSDVPELADLPWEFLYDPRNNRFLAQSRRTPLVRYLDLPDPPHPLSVEGPLRLLVMISSPSDYAELDAEQEWSLLTGALAEQQAQGRVIVERLAANMSTLRHRLRQEAFHVFHFIGHGRYRPDWGSGVLVMQDRTGRSQEVTGEELGGLLSEYDQTRLAVLNACEGARGDASDPFAGVAQSLIQQGLPAVVAMQFEITDDAAIIFAREFYGAMADGYPLEAALAEARGAIRDDGNLTEWGTPVLYSRAPDGRLFDRASQAREDAERQAREDAERQAREDAERQAREDAERQAREDAERQAREDAERQAREDAERQAREDAERQAREDAERQAREDLATHYALACAASEARDWDQALTVFTMVADVDPGYPDVQERIENARRQQQIARWQAEARRLHRAAHWAAVVEAGEQLQELDPAAADPDGLVTSARAELAAEERTERLDADYERALLLLDAGHWRRAIAMLERVAQVNPTYRATPALLDRARQAREEADRQARATRRNGSPPKRPSQAAPPSLTGPSTLAQYLTDHKNWGGFQFLGAMVAFSPDGRLLACGGGEKTVRLWDPVAGTHLRTLTGHTKNVNAVAFSPDGRLLASAGWDKTVRLWDPVAGTHLRTLTGHTGAVLSVAFSPDGRLLASAGWDKTIRLWDPVAGTHLRTLTGHTKNVNAVAFSPDGRLLASAGWDKTIRLWDPVAGTHLRTLTGHTDTMWSVAFSPDGRLLASANDDKTIRLWDPVDGTHLRTLTGHTSTAYAVAFSPDGRLLASASWDKTVRLWDPVDGTHLRTLTGHTRGVLSVAFSPDGRLLASFGADPTIRLWT